MIKKIKNNLTTRLTVLVLLVTIIPALIAFAYNSYTMKDFLFEEAKKHLTLTTIALGANVKNWDQRVALALINLSRLPALRTMDPEKQIPVLKNVAQTYSFYAASTIREDGKALARKDGKKLKNYGDRYWFKRAMAGYLVTRQPLISRSTGKPVLIYSTAIRDKEKRIVGAVNVGTFLTEMHKIINTIKIGESGYVFCVDGLGRVLAHPNPKFTGEKLINLKDYAPVKKGLLQKDKKGMIFPFTDQEGIEWLSYIHYLKSGWMVISQQKQSEILAHYHNQLLVSLISFVVQMAVIIIFVWIVAKQVTRPIFTITQAIQKNWEEGDFSQKIEMDRQDELGFLAKQFNKFSSVLGRIISQIIQSIQHTKTISLHLEGLSEQSVTTLNRMIVVIEKMKEKISNLDQEIQTSNQSIHEMKDFISHVVHQISSQASSIKESSDSVEEMSSSIQNVADVSEEKLKVVKNLEQTASSGEKEMRESMEIIKKVADSAHLIMDMIAVINGIAEQTNLLAMNAAIEAAHAGDSGKGFAVVADEIRKLAEDTSKNSKEISNSLKEVIQFIHLSEDLTQKTGLSFENMVQSIKEVTIGMLEIKTSMNNLADGSNDILKALSHLVQTADEVKTASDDMNHKVGNIAGSMVNLNEISSTTKNRMEEVVTGINDLFQTVKSVSTEGLKNMMSVGELEELVSQLKISDGSSLPAVQDENGRTL